MLPSLSANKVNKEAMASLPKDVLISNLLSKFHALIVFFFLSMCHIPIHQIQILHSKNTRCEIRSGSPAPLLLHK